MAGLFSGAFGKPQASDRADPRMPRPIVTRKFTPLSSITIDDVFADLLAPIPETALAVPSMTSVAERRFLFNFAKQRYSGQGLIFDGGVFLGASTRCFGEGLDANPKREEILKRWGKPILSFDRAIVSPNMPDFFRRHGVDFKGAPGDSFADALVKNIQPVAPYVDLRLGDICQTSASIKEPIEALFLDVLKLPQISVDLVGRLFPLLIPGVSVVIQQDYFYDKLPYIVVDQEFFGGHFEFVAQLSSTAVFLCTKAIPAEKIAAFRAGIPPAEQAALASVAIQRSIDPFRRFLVALAKVRHVFRLHGVAAARAEFEAVKSAYPEQVKSEISRLVEALRSTEQFIAARDRPGWRQESAASTARPLRGKPRRLTP